MFKKIFIILFYLSPLSAFAGTVDVSVATGVNYYEITTEANSASSAAYVSDMMAKIEADWLILKGFFLGASGTMPIINEHSSETVSYNLNTSKNSFSFGEKNLDIYGGYQIITLFNPFLGISISELNISRTPRIVNTHGISEDQSYNNYDFLMGFKGTYEFNDYSSMGYLLTYQTSGNADGEINSRDFKDVDSSKIASSVFFKYWLPNEFMEIGLHLYGGRTMYDKKSSANELLPDTDIKFVGAFLSFKVNL